MRYDDARLLLENEGFKELTTSLIETYNRNLRNAALDDHNGRLYALAQLSTLENLIEEIKSHTIIADK